MSGSAAPVTVHSGIFVQSRLPIILHRVLPTGTLTLHNIGMLEAGLLGVLLQQMLFAGRYPSSWVELWISAGIGMGAYHMAPP